MTGTDLSTPDALCRRSDHDALIHSILDDGVFCHLGFQVICNPIVIPTIYVRTGKTLFLHGSFVSSAMYDAGEEFPVSVAVTHVHRRLFVEPLSEQTLTYRAAILFGRARRVRDEREKLSALRLLAKTISLNPREGRESPIESDIPSAIVYSMNITEAFAKVRSINDVGREHGLVPSDWDTTQASRSIRRSYP